MGVPATYARMSGPHFGTLFRERAKKSNVFVEKFTNTRLKNLEAFMLIIFC